MGMCYAKKVFGERALDVRREKTHRTHYLSCQSILVLLSDNHFVIQSLCPYYFVAKLIT